MAYIGVSPSNGVRKKHTYTATASQTSFSGAGDEGITLAYRDSNYVDVYQNGVKLSEADYTSTSGTAIVLATGATVSDMIEVVVYDVFSVADTVSKSAGGTFDGNVAMAGTLDVTGETTISNHLNMGDTDSIKLGAGADLTLISDGANGTIAAPNGTLTLDVAGDITLDAGGQNIIFKDDGTEFGQIYQESNHLNIYSSINNADLKIQGNNGGAVITAIELDMSAAGSAYFNSTVYIPQLLTHTGDTDTNLEFGTNTIALRAGNVKGISVKADEVVVNDGSADLDFRVESNGNANMLFVQGSDSRVGIGTNILGAALCIDPDTNVTTDFGTPLVKVGGSNSWAGAGSLYSIGFGYNNGATVKSPAEIGMVTNDAGGVTRGDLVFAMRGNTNDEAPTEKLRLNSAGRLLLGTTSHFYDGIHCTLFDGTTQNGLVLKTTRAATGTNFIALINSSGALAGRIFHNGSTTVQFLTSSDYRLKENVNYNFDATTRLKQLKPARFNFIEDGTDKVVDGFLAHEVSSIVPEAICGEKDAMKAEVLYAEGDVIPDGKKVGDVKEASQIDPQGIDQSKLVPLLVKTIQELEARITALENA